MHTQAHWQTTIIIAFFCLFFCWDGGLLYRLDWLLHNPAGPALTGIPRSQSPELWDYKYLFLCLTTEGCRNRLGDDVSCVMFCLGLNSLYPQRSVSTGSWHGSFSSPQGNKLWLTLEREHGMLALLIVQIFPRPLHCVSLGNLSDVFLCLNFLSAKAGGWYSFLCRFVGCWNQFL